MNRLLEYCEVITNEEMENYNGIKPLYAYYALIGTKYT